MKKVKFLFVALAAMSLAFASCSSDEPKKTDPVVTPPDATLEEAPSITKPAAGFVTVAVRIPAGSICQGLVAVGTNGTTELGWTPSAGNSLTKVTGTDTWYSITLTYAADMVVKVIAVPEAGLASTTWSTQWGMNTTTTTNVTFVEPLSTTAVLDNTENGGEVKLTTLSDQDVVYIDVAAWKSAPCVAKNAAGTATFKVTVPATTPANASVSVVGSWGAEGDADYWTPGAHVMTRNTDGTYSLSIAVPASFQYKYVVSADGTTWSWDNQFETQFDMPVSLSAVDVVTAWKADPISIP